MVAAIGAGALALIAGCGGGSGGTGSAAPRPLTPHQVITLAADESQHVNSIAANMSMVIAGTVSETLTGNIQVQLKPILLADENLIISSQGQTIPMTDIVSAKAVYLKSAAFSSLTGQTGKTWIKIPLTEMSGTGSALSSLLQDVQNGDPLTQTSMLAASKNVRAVGTQVIDGVRTTHYAGTFTAAAALAELPANLRTQLAPMLKLITGDIQFNAWIDAQHQLRKLTETETVMSETVNMTMDVTSVNQPVHVSLPPARRTMVLPASAFNAGGTSS
jgi:hypothetical protein